MDFITKLMFGDDVSKADLDSHRDMIARSVRSTKQFRELENRLRDEYGIEYGENQYSSQFYYISSLLLVKMMEGTFKETGIKLPEKLNVIDIGSGRWDYINSLYRFLMNYDAERHVAITGIDLKGGKYAESVKKLTNGINAEYVDGDVLKLDQKDSYDMAFIAHMLSSDNHFRKFGLRPRPVPDIYKKAFDLTKKDGIVVGIQYEYGGESAILDKNMPSESSIYEKHYSIGGGISGLLSGYHTFDDNVINICRK